MRAHSILCTSLPLLLHLLLHGQVKADLSNLDFCFGEASICVSANDLHKGCDAYNTDHSNLKPWHVCLCGNGYVSVEEACNWCQAAYDIDSVDVMDTWSQDCSSAGATIAPIPSNIMARESAYNATYTGPPPSNVASTTQPSTETSAVTTTTVAGSTSVAPSTYFGGTTGVMTYDGGSGATATRSSATAAIASPSATPTQSAAAAAAAAAGGKSPDIKGVRLGVGLLALLLAAV